MNIAIATVHSFVRSHTKNAATQHSIPFGGESYERENDGHKLLRTDGVPYQEWLNPRATGISIQRCVGSLVGRKFRNYNNSHILSSPVTPAIVQNKPCTGFPEVKQPMPYLLVLYVLVPGGKRQGPSGMQKKLYLINCTYHGLVRFGVHLSFWTPKKDGKIKWDV